MNKHVISLMAGALLCANALAQEIIIDNVVGPKFSISGTWGTSTATAGYTGPNYHTHTAGTEYVGQAIMDNGGVGTQSTGAWSSSVASAGYYGTNYQAAPAGTGQNTYTWNIGSVVSVAGNYNVFARWTSGTNRADNATYTVTVNGTPTPVSVNQKQGGGQWQLLGTYALTPGQASVTLNNQANGYVIADAIRVTPVNQQTAHVLWSPQVTQNGLYDVYARWTAATNRATNAPYTVQHADGQTTVVANQRLNGAQWRLLGNFKLNGNSAIKLSSDNTDGFVIADSVRLVLTQADSTPQAYYIHSDHLNTPRVITDAQNQTVWRQAPTTEPFGDSAPEEDPDANGTNFNFNLRFPGQYFDKETNLSYNYFRDFDPNTGRYIQSDPIGMAGGINTYSYAGNDPIKFVDPSGLATCIPIVTPFGLICVPVLPPVPSTATPSVWDDFGDDIPESAVDDKPGRKKPPYCPPPGDSGRCMAEYAVEVGMCAAIAGIRYGPAGFTLCESSATTRLGECLKYGPTGKRTPLHGVQTPL